MIHIWDFILDFFLDPNGHFDFWSAWINSFSASKKKTNTVAKPQHEYDKKLMQSGGWTCKCGKVNPSYTSTCVCGRSKYKLSYETKYPTNH